MKPFRKRSPALSFLGFASFFLVLGAFPANAQPYPAYDFEVTLDAEKRVLQGRVTVSFPENTGAPGGRLWFRLPPNRFAGEDPRGPRRWVDSVPVGIRFSARDPFDPLLPNGFSNGSIEILGVEDEAGAPLPHQLESDPNIPPGYWRENALLRVDLPDEISGKSVTITFATRLPNRHLDGWNDFGILAESWHPVLLPKRDGQWDKHPFAPAGGRFGGRIVVKQSGILLAGAEIPRDVESGTTLEIPMAEQPRRVFPVLFFAGAEVLRETAGGVRFNAFFREGNEAQAAFALKTAGQFQEFLYRRYGLEPPEGVVNLVQSDVLKREFMTVGNTIVMPTVYLKNNSVLNRLLVGKLTRALAEIWFGETVWSNRDTEAWLHLGLTGFLALDYFRFLYGWDAGIHELLDWLNPKYREHFFEAPVLSRFRARNDKPLAMSLYGYPHSAAAMVNMYQKAPLVFRSLSHVMGRDAFAAGLRLFFQRYRRREATIEDFREAMEEGSGLQLKRYFDAWFYGTMRVDYALAGWSEEPTAEGYRVTVRVERKEKGIIPVDIQVQTKGGGQVTQRWNGESETATLVFEVRQPVEKIVVDPEEFLLEENRQNNHSSHDIRWRPFYDWAKERESLVTFLIRLGGNAIDGNTIGLGANIRFDSENQLSVIPILGSKKTKTFRNKIDDQLSFLPLYGVSPKETLFELSYIRGNFFNHRFTFLASASKLGGRETLSSGIKYSHPSLETNVVSTTFLLTAEQVESASLGISADTPIQQAGNTNNINLQNSASFRNGMTNSFSWFLDLENSQPGFGSDFNFTTLLARFGQTLDAHVNHSFQFTLVRGLTAGGAPIQKRHLLGDPLVLRGFPRTVALVSDNIAALRSEYRYVISRRIFGKTIQTRKITAILFADIGKGWDNDVAFGDALTRRNVGFGFNLDLNALSMMDFPLRVEVAFPLGDPVYKDSQFIFFQAIAFF